LVGDRDNPRRLSLQAVDHSAAWSRRTGGDPATNAADTVVAALRDRGCHQTDIGDAFYEADPEWQLRP